VHNYRPVFDALKDSIFVYNKDAHPENWIVGDKLGVIDCEGRLLVPAQFDLANLLEYGDFFSDAQKSEYIGHYLYCARFDVNKEEFMLGYWNAVVHRMLGLSSAWSSPLRPSMRPKRVDAIRRALHAIDKIEEDHGDWFKQYHENYAGLRQDLSEVSSIIN